MKKKWALIGSIVFTLLSILISHETVSPKKVEVSNLIAVESSEKTASDVTKDMYPDAKKIVVDYVKHIDGDTTVFMVNGVEEKIRYLAIDTEETVHPTKESTEKGKQASSFVKRRLEEAKIIELEYDSKSALRDKYGRILAWVWVDGSLLQEELVREELAVIKYVYGDYKYLDQLKAAQKISEK